MTALRCAAPDAEEIAEILGESKKGRVVLSLKRFG